MVEHFSENMALFGLINIKRSQVTKTFVFSMENSILSILVHFLPQYFLPASGS